MNKCDTIVLPLQLVNTTHCYPQYCTYRREVLCIISLLFSLYYCNTYHPYQNGSQWEAVVAVVAELHAVRAPPGLFDQKSKQTLIIKLIKAPHPLQFYTPTDFNPAEENATLNLIKHYSTP